MILRGTARALTFEGAAWVNLALICITISRLGTTDQVTLTDLRHEAIIPEVIRPVELHRYDEVHTPLDSGPVLGQGGRHIRMEETENVAKIRERRRIGMSMVWYWTPWM